MIGIGANNITFAFFAGQLSEVSSFRKPVLSFEFRVSSSGGYVGRFHPAHRGRETRKNIVSQLETRNSKLETQFRPVAGVPPRPLQSAASKKGKFMLKQLSRLKHTRNILIFGFVLFMAASLVMFYRPGSSGISVEPSKNTDVLAKVNGEDITVADLAQLKETYLQMTGGQISLAQLGGNKRFLESLIQKRVVSQEAARLGLGASQ
jgi:SurA N-terminal domain